jgi:hypothetical protein
MWSAASGWRGRAPQQQKGPEQKPRPGSSYL